jgi:hypothetical protein
MGLHTAVARLLLAGLAIATTGGCNAAIRNSGGPPPGAAVAGTDCPADVREAFYRAADGDARALAECSRLLDRCGGDAPRALAYRGGCRTLEAARAAMPWDKGRLVREGAALLDEAVRAAPDDLEVRFVRGMASYHLPRFLGREGVAAQDLALVSSRAEDAVRSSELDLSTAAAALFHYGKLLKRRGDEASATELWRRAVTLGPTTRAGEAASRALQSDR